MQKLFFILLLFPFYLLAQDQKTSNFNLIDFSPSECDESAYSYQKYNQILSKEIVGDTVKIEVEIVGNCCVDFDATIEVNDTIINLIYMESGDPCRCLCCYQFIYEIDGVNKDQKMVYLLNGRGVKGSQ
ncbi:MAG: hypothetical protein JKX95_07695 [Bacteroidia bacterium]|nr:hypothetical protein [Bacteroidia bacterium]